MSNGSPIPPSDILEPQTVAAFACPECGKGCFIGFRATEGISFVCPQHGTFYGTHGSVAWASVVPEYWLRAHGTARSRAA